MAVQKDNERLQSMLDHLRALLIWLIAPEIHPVIDQEKLVRDIEWLEKILR
jgi:hypothetical protein